MWAGNLAGARGENTQALEFNRRAVALDPVNAQARAFLASSLSGLGRQEEARAEYAREIELNPSAPNSYAGIGLEYLLEGKFEEAAVAAQKDAADWARLLIVSCARWGQKRVAESDAALAELIANTAETGAYQIAEAYAYRNDKDKAFEWLERARRQRDAGLPGLRADTLLPNLHDDPRWDAFLRKVGLADDQLKRLRRKACPTHEFLLRAEAAQRLQGRDRFSESHRPCQMVAPSDLKFEIRHMSCSYLRSRQKNRLETVAL
jgi:tetratricopeptide (TPR) repeat protein